jgi:hypothetical protein
LTDGEKVFFMTPPGQENATNRRSGLYRNTDPPEVIYHTDTYIHQHNLYQWHISSNGVYFVVAPSVRISRHNVTLWEEGTDNVIVHIPVLRFYSEGIEQRRYEVGELMRDIRNVHLFGMNRNWLSWTNVSPSLNPDTNILTVVTIEDVTIKFDITTGEIVYMSEDITKIINEIILHDSETTDGGGNATYYIIAGGVILLLMICVLWRRRRFAQHPPHQP